MSEPLSVEQLKVVGRILMGAAHADGDYAGSEALAIRKILRRLVGGDVPREVAFDLVAFRPTAFDLVEACRSLGLAGPDDRRRLLVLVAAVGDADATVAVSEDNYLRRVAGLIGADPAEYADLTLTDTQRLAVAEVLGPEPV